jgi:hypothetical protein
MTDEATSLGVLKGGLKKDQSFTFTETAWVGPKYQTGEVRVLFLERESENRWRILSNLYAKADFFVEQDAVPRLSLTSLRTVLERLQAPTVRSIFITQEMLK